MNEADKARACFESIHCFLSELMISEDPEIQLHVDEWRREEGGGGKTSALSNGVWMEKEESTFQMFKAKTYLLPLPKIALN